MFDRYVGTVGEIEHISGSMLTLRAHMQWVREDVHELLILLHLTAALRGEEIMIPTACELDGWPKFRSLHLLLRRLGGRNV